MDGFIMLSILLATVAVPALAARDPNAPRGARRMVLALLVVNSLYVAYAALVHVVVRVPQWR